MFYAKEDSVWSTEKGPFDSMNEAIDWANSNLKGKKWNIWKKGAGGATGDVVYSN